MERMNRSDWNARAEAASQAANRWAAVAQDHEAASRRDCWSKSVMVAMEARDNEARCRSSAAHAREMACDVR
jgi:hypothetical protein